ncbi:serine/threonine-protein kinase cst-1-like, partial [Oppia nitens]|uniref:serine/threonine-protein kinase cst-1-like n=1 Tax=Oppia nitens TaxID=1686743 RepID=UPI0023D98551
FTKEIDSLTSLVSPYLVKYYGSCLHSNKIYIAMEFCIMSLKEAIKLKAQVFSRQPFSGQPMDCIEYFITCELLRELLECVNGLHELSVIHRDLKPENILITHSIQNGRFVKLCDYGFMTVHQSNGQLHTNGLGTPKYMAPEVKARQLYDTKSDIYSIGITIEDMFETNINCKYNKYKSCGWSAKYLKLLDIIRQTTGVKRNLRPTCAEILAQYQDWSIDYRLFTGNLMIFYRLLELKDKERELRVDDRNSEPEFWEFVFSFFIVQTTK